MIRVKKDFNFVNEAIVGYNKMKSNTYVKQTSKQWKDKEVLTAVQNP